MNCTCPLLSSNTPASQGRTCRGKIPKMTGRWARLCLLLWGFSLCHPFLFAQEPSTELCPRPVPGSLVTEPEDLRSEQGVLNVELTVHNVKEADGNTRYCYLLPDGSQSPTLRLHPGDLLVLKLKNAVTSTDSSPSAGSHTHHQANASRKSDPCVSGLMSATSTNLHFHGLTVPPVCHQDDDVLKTSIQPEDPPFEYRFRIPENEPRGLYWYHPHIHGFSTPQVLGGASGALVIEGHRTCEPRTGRLAGARLCPSRSESVKPQSMSLSRKCDGYAELGLADCHHWRSRPEYKRSPHEFGQEL